MTLTHPWNVTPQEAFQIQKGLRGRVRLVPLSAPPKTVAGVDVSMEWPGYLRSGQRHGTEGFACIVLFSFPELERGEATFSKNRIRFPYVPGLLSFREIPLLLEAWKALPKKPDILIVDGHGIAHPRRMGIAVHLGVLLDVPAIGVAKSVLVGEYAEPGLERGSRSYLRHNGEVIGAALRTKDNVAPVYISPGHLVTLNQAIDIVLGCDGGYRLPEPTRVAHELVNEFRRSESEKIA